MDMVFDTSSSSLYRPWSYSSAIIGMSRFGFVEPM